MPQVVRANTPQTGSGTEPSAPAFAFRLPPAMAEKAVSRLCWLSLICAITTVLSFVIQGRLQPEIAESQKDPVYALVALFLVLISAAFIAVQRFHLLSAYTILNLGLVFEVVVAFSIAFYETSTQIPADQLVRGGSMVAVWITVCGLLIPNTPLMAWLAAFASAFMWPLAYRLNMEIHDFPPLPWNRLGVYLFVNFMMAFWAYFLNKRIYSMEVAAQRAQELGSYQLVSLLGSGGMGEVWRARHRMLARDAAIKLIRPEILASQAGRQASMVRRRFEREAQATSSLRNAHTVMLYDFGMADDGSFYYVMELLDGVNLQALVEKFGPQPAGRVVHLLKQVCDSLEEAHRAGMVHRDIKPTNIFTCSMGLEHDFVKVLDFGLVKQLGQAEGTLVTMDGMAAGTPAYMAPEIAMGEAKIDGRSDLYSVGCVAYFLLTGQMVFNESTPTATALAHVQKAPVPPSERCEVPIPPELEKLVLQCLAKSPDDRPRSAQELRRMLDRAAGVEPWCRDTASNWWNTNLPVTSAERSTNTPAPRVLAAALSGEGDGA